MDLLFKINGTETAESQIKDSNFKDHFPAINRTMSWASLKPFIRRATRNYIIPYLGDDFYDALVTYYTSGSGDDLMDEILEITQDALAHYTIYDAMPAINIVLSDMGAQENSSENASSQPASQWRYKSARWNAIQQADRSMDELLDVLYDNKDEADLSDWIGTPANDFFPDPETLKSYLSHDISWRLFIAMIPYMKKALDKWISPVVTSQQLEDLITKIQAGSTSARENQLTEKIRYALAERSLQLAIPHLRLVIDSGSINFMSSTDGMTMLQTANQQAIDDLKHQVRSDADAYEGDLKNFLYTYHEDFEYYRDNGHIDGYRPNVISSPDEIGGFIIH